jgi:hypothetical protein
MAKKLTHLQAEKIMLKAKLKPLELYKSSGEPWKCRCLICKSLCNPTFGNIKQGRGGCVECAIKKRGNTKRLSNQITINLMLKKGLKPLEPYKGAKFRWKCRCSLCKKIVYPTYWNVRNSASKKKGCAICIGVKVDPKEVKEKMLLAGLRTYGPYPGKDLGWKSKCLTCGKVVSPTWNNIRNGSGGCGSCRYVKSGKSNRSLEKDVIKFMVEAELLPLESYVNKDMPWKCRCMKCKQTVYPTAGNVKRGQGGCSYCRETGLNYKDPSYIYLIYHQEFESIKIGVSNNDSRPNRLKSHQKMGWSVYKTKNYKTGFTAEKVETGILRWLRKDLMLGRHLTLDLMPQGGHSETVDASEIDLPSIWAKVEQLSKKALKN